MGKIFLCLIIFMSFAIFAQEPQSTEKKQGSILERLEKAEQRIKELEDTEKQREEQIVAFMIYGLHHRENFYKICAKWIAGERQFKFWTDSGQNPENSGQTIWIFLKRNGKIIQNDKWVPGTDEHSSPAFWNLPMQEPEETSEFCTPKWFDSGFFCLDTSGKIPQFKIVYEYPKTINMHPLLWFQPGHVVALVKGNFAIGKGTVGQIIQK